MIKRPPPGRDNNKAIAAAFLRDEPALGSSLDFGPFVRQGMGHGPALLIGDASEIPLLTATPQSRVEYRMALLAEAGDHVVVRRRDKAFERYLSRYLGMTDVTFHEVHCADHVPLTEHLWTSSKWIDAFAAVSRRHAGLTITSYLTTGHAWRLAQTLGQRSGQVVHVAGPSPRISRHANDKLWFSDLVHRLLGDAATPPTLAAYGPAAAAGLVRRTCKIADQVVVKVPDSAGSAGNLRLDRAFVKERSLAELKHFILARLRGAGWQDHYPILVGVWDKDVVCSPSVQLWLPHSSAGPPVLEGIFEQRIRTETTAFVGASKSALPKALLARLGAQAVQIAGILQHLDYFGRCSLDAVVCQTGTARPKIHCIECNGRWGGVSIPITAARRLVPKTTPPAISIVQEVFPDRHLGTGEMVHRLRNLLFEPANGPSGVVLVSPPSSPQGVLVNLLAMAETQPQADGLLENAIETALSNGRP